MSHPSFKITFAKAVPCLFLLAACFALSACGKRAAHVDPPPDLVKDDFPRTYPDPTTDPKPGSPND